MARPNAHERADRGIAIRVVSHDAIIGSFLDDGCDFTDMLKLRVIAYSKAFMEALITRHPRP